MTTKKDKIEKPSKKMLVHSGHSSCIYLGSYNKRECVIKAYYDKNNIVLLREVEILRKISHSNIIELCMVYNKTIVMQFHGVTLRSLLQNTKTYENEANSVCQEQKNNYKNIAKQILDGVKYLHSVHIVHFDLKPENIVVLNGTAKIIDFGSAKYFDEKVLQYNFTNAYTSLEYLLGYNKAHPCQDVWSFGCIMYELENLSALVESKNTIQTILSLIDIFGSPDKSVYVGLEIKHLDFFSIYNRIAVKYREKFKRYNEKETGFYNKIFNMNPLTRIQAKDIILDLHTG